MDRKNNGLIWEWLKEYWLAGLVLISGCLLSFAFYGQLQTIDENRLNEHFMQVSQKQTSHLQWNLTSYTNALHSAVDLFSSEERVENEKFYSIARIIRQRYPEILALEWLPRVTSEERDSFEKEIRESYNAPFAIKQLNLKGKLQKSSEKEKYYPVTFVEPFANAAYNQNFLGFDHFSMESRRQMIQRARDEGSITATPALTFPRISSGGQQIQSPNNNMGIVLYKPVFRGAEAPEKEEAKHEEPVGILALLLRIQSVIGPVFEDSQFPHNIAVFEHHPPARGKGEKLIYTNRPPGEVKEKINNEEDGINFRKQLPVLNQSWSVFIWPDKQYLAGQRSWAPTLALSLGFLLTGFFTFSSYRFSSRFRGNIKRFHSVIESAEDAIITLNEAGSIQLWNPAAENIFGYEAQEIVGTPFDKIISEADESYFRQEKQGQGESVPDFLSGTVEMTGVRKDGSEFPIDVTISSWKQFGESYFTFIIRDITERKNKEEKLKELNVNLEEKVKARTEELEQFVYAASHDLREPARVIQTYAEFLEEDLESNNEKNVKKDVEFIRNSANQMSQLINSLLKLSRINSEELHLETVSIEECVSEAFEQQEIALDGSELKISYEDLPEVKADPALLIDLYRNLIGNAIKHGDKGETKITLTAEEETEKWILGVKDNGPGIAPEFHDTIFQPFKHLRSDDHENTGIGLSICRRIIERHDGKIWVESEPGEGAHFRFTIA